MDLYLRRRIHIFLTLTLLLMSCHLGAMAPALSQREFAAEEAEYHTSDFQLEQAMVTTDTTEAFELIGKSMASAAREGREDLVFAAHLASGKAGLRFGKYGRALASLELAQQMAITQKYWSGLAEAYYVKALVYNQLNDRVKSLSAAKAAKEYVQDIETDSMAVVITTFLASEFYTSHQFQNCYEVALLGLSRTKTTDYATKAVFYSYLGSVCDEWGVYLSSLQYYQKASESALKSGKKELLSMAYNNIGLVLKKLKRYEEATNYLERSLAIDKGNDDLPGMADVYNNLGLVSLETGAWEKALTYMKLSYDLVKNSNDPLSLSIAYNNFGDIYLKLGKTKLALQYAEKSLEIDRIHGSEVDVARSLMTRGQVLMRLGQKGEALADFRESEQLCLKNRLTPDLAELYEHMATLYNESGEHDLAFRFLQQNKSLHDSLYNDRLMNQALWITIENNLAEKQREIDALKIEEVRRARQLEEKQQLIRRQRMFQHSLILAVFIVVVSMVMLYRVLNKNRIMNLKLVRQNVKMEYQRKNLVEALDKAKEADRLKDNFLASMNHELRTPLNGIIGFAEILESEVPDKFHVEMARSIHESGSRLMNTLDGLLKLSQIERNMVDVSFTIFSVSELLERVGSRYATEARLKGLDFIIRLPATPIRLSTDDTLFERVVESLLDNAVKFTSSGSVVLAADGVDTPAGYRSVISVKDTGIGISYDKLETIFQDFRQVSEGLVRDYEGSGIGLSLCRSYLTLLGGDLKVSSTPGEGSEFVIVMPALREEIGGVERQFNRYSPGDEAHASLLNLPTILLVEDDDINREFALYTMAGLYNVAVATTAQMALKMVQNQIFDAVLLDINLGRDMSGVDVVGRLRLMEGYEKVPVAAVTANVQKGEKERLLASGFNRYLPKPYSRKELLALIDSMLREVAGGDHRG